MLKILKIYLNNSLSKYNYALKKEKNKNAQKQTQPPLMPMTIY